MEAVIVWALFTFTNAQDAQHFPVMTLYADEKTCEKHRAGVLAASENDPFFEGKELRAVCNGFKLIKGSKGASI